MRQVAESETDIIIELEESEKYPLTKEFKENGGVCLGWYGEDENDLTEEWLVQGKVIDLVVVEPEIQRNQVVR